MKSVNCLFYFLVAFCFSNISAAQSEGLLNKLLAPGPLILGHMNLEGKDCLKCHAAGKGISDAKCMDCHKEIKKHFDAKKGFHGLNTQACMKCHSDHKGREFDSAAIDEKSFEHEKMTGYSLDGKHADIKCVECHKEKRTEMAIRKKETRYFGQVALCTSCHAKDDIHFFKGEFAKKDCNACHTSKTWKDSVKFNHDKDTKFKLEGQHAELKCVECHQPNKKQKKVMKYSWKNLQQAQCLACHKDFHKNNLSAKFSGGKCTSCHTQTKWKIEKFNHEITKYKLNGMHAEIKCVDCHKPTQQKFVNKIEIKNLNFTGLKTQCLSCHQDFHKFGAFKSEKMGNLNQCLKCHNEKDWKQIHSFDHKTNVRFALDGEHVPLKCTTCHLPNPKDLKTNPKNLFTVKMPTYHWQQLDLKTCEQCHKSPHVGVFSQKLLQQKCTTCHTTVGWAMTKAGTGFNHDNTRFALTGSHKQTKCADCHGSTGKQIFKFVNVQSKFCIDCHANIHIKQFSSNYAAQSCTLCHTTQNFTELITFDHDKTKYPLLGEHAKAKCSECHKPMSESINLKWPNFKSKNHAELKPKSRAKFLFPEIKQSKCLTCHTDYHKGQLSANCAECHSEKGWRPSSFNHNTQSRFILKDKHEKLDCVKCHLVTKEIISYKNKNYFVNRYKPIKTDCINCHNDPHKGSLGRNCQDCHSEKNWTTTKDFHKNFSLIGVHYMLSCTECHQAGKKLSGLSQQCFTCHQKDDVHNGMLPNCKACHTQHFWEASQFKHSLTKLPLRGAHRTLECAECHTNGLYKGLSSTCVACHLDVYLANPGPHGTGNTSCADCHKNTFTFKSAN